MSLADLSSFGLPRLLLASEGNDSTAVGASLDDAPADDPVEVEAAWAREIERRARRVMSGESTGEAWTDVRARIMNRLNEQ